MFGTKIVIKMYQKIAFEIAFTLVLKTIKQRTVYGRNLLGRNAQDDKMLNCPFKVYTISKLL